jgi:hypothetical protein
MTLRTKQLTLALILTIVLPALAEATEVAIVAHVGGVPVPFVANARGDGSLQGSAAFGSDIVKITSGSVSGSRVLLSGVITRAGDPAVIGQTVTVTGDTITGEVTVQTSFGFSGEGSGVVLVK